MIGKIKNGIEIRKSNAIIIRKKNTITEKKKTMVRKKDTGQAAYHGAKKNCICAMPI